MSQVLFCPFCKDSFEGVDRCPEHDLALVPFDELPRAPREQADDAPMQILDPRRGRGELALAGVSLLVAFVLPLVEVAVADRSQSFSTLAAATQRAPNLWAIPASGAILLSTVARRRVPLRMRGARLALSLVALVPIVSVVYSVRRIFEAGALDGATVSMGVAPHVIIAAALVAIVGSLRFGGAPPSRGAGPSEPDTGLSR